VVQKVIDLAPPYHFYKKWCKKVIDLVPPYHFYKKWCKSNRFGSTFSKGGKGGFKRIDK
jgi:hypothetical protein